MIAYIRQKEGSAGFLIVLNLTHRPCYFRPSNIKFKGRVVIDTFPEEEQLQVEDNIDLGGDEAMVVKLEQWQ
jgi:alpha-glucosidase